MEGGGNIGCGWGNTKLCPPVCCWPLAGWGGGWGFFICQASISETVTCSWPIDLIPEKVTLASNEGSWLKSMEVSLLEKVSTTNRISMKIWWAARQWYYCGLVRLQNVTNPAKDPGHLPHSMTNLFIGPSTSPDVKTHLRHTRKSVTKNN